MGSLEYFSGIFQYLKKGHILGAIARAILPVIFIVNQKRDQLKYQVIKFRNRNTDEIIVDINNRYKMFLDLQDKGICLELAVHKKREYFSTDYIQTIIHEDDVVIDIGANIGYYALLESQLAPNGHVYAIEPVPENLILLKKNVDLNHCTNISMHNCAIGDIQGQLEMYIYDRCNWASLIKNPNEGNVVGMIPVPVTTLDEFIESNDISNPTFIRMDVEGYEYNILKGASTTLKRSGPLIIFIEFHANIMPIEKSIECLKILKENGFEVKCIIQETKSGREYEHMRSISYFRNILNLPKFGKDGKGFGPLEDLINRKLNAMVFLEKTN